MVLKNATRFWKSYRTVLFFLKKNSKPVDLLMVCMVFTMSEIRKCMKCISPARWPPIPTSTNFVWWPVSQYVWKRLELNIGEIWGVVWCEPQTGSNFWRVLYRGPHLPTSKHGNILFSNQISFLDQFSLLITNTVSDFAGDHYFFMIFLFKDHGPAIHSFKIVWEHGWDHFFKKAS